MSERIQRFLAAASQPGPLHDALRSVGGEVPFERAVEIGAAHGFVLTVEELAAFGASQPMSDAALDGVVGAGISFVSQTGLNGLTATGGYLSFGGNT